ncbi:hypothetical protein ACJJID_17315 [Microbulbifer sp. CnH-101-G]|uniref:hypothetical protein n=1 Tax=Microbulbifer sp. CnH-101-G TaxID=3243393 RepID=UPI00403A29F1
MRGSAQPSKAAVYSAFWGAKLSVAERAVIVVAQGPARVSLTGLWAQGCLVWIPPVAPWLGARNCNGSSVRHNRIFDLYPQQLFRACRNCHSIISGSSDYQLRSKFLSVEFIAFGIASIQA